MQVSEEAAADVVRRLRRVEGQVGGIIRMIEGGRECADVVTQMAAVSKAFERAAFKLVAAGLRQCLVDAEGGVASDLDEATLERLFLALA